LLASVTRLTPADWRAVTALAGAKKSYVLG
jgi:hypothetical protein